MRCLICGDEIKSTDGEAVHFELFGINCDNANNGNICGDCVIAEKFFKLWRKAEDNHDDK